MRPEEEIFGELAKLCATPGYAHAIAFVCFRDNMVSYQETIKAEDYAKLFSFDRLIRTEVSTLIGLMTRAPIDFAIPTHDTIEKLVQRTEELLLELHTAMNQSVMSFFAEATTKGRIPENPFDSADAMREPIFYGPESAYSFQYRDLAPKKYARDDAWLQSNKGFAISEARDVVAAAGTFQNKKLISSLHKLRSVPRDKWTLLDGFMFSAQEIADIAKLSAERVTTILDSFSFKDDGNPTFTALHEYNETNAYPILKTPDERYVLFQYVSLTEALYDTPFYWMSADESYRAAAMANRGTFAEKFAAERLERVFGSKYVLRNVRIWKSKTTEIGEIDALVHFGDRAIVVQAKSKKLTLAARKGNDLQLRSDFKNAIQSACDQAFICAELLASRDVTFTDSAGIPIAIPSEISEIFPICVVSDHYPALAFQARQFLKFNATERIKAPFVSDVFTLDAMTEMLESPLRLLSYLQLRTLAADKLFTQHETVALSYHLKQNLWLSGEYDFVQLGDDISADLDIAMAVRRDGVPGARTPSGILTALSGTAFGHLIRELEKETDRHAMSAGLFLLTINEESALSLGEMIDMIADQANTDFLNHDATLGFSSAKSGITLHCNDFPLIDAVPALKTHCERRKYVGRADTWFGILIHPKDRMIRHVVALEYPWEPDAELEKIAKGLPIGRNPKRLRRILKRRKP